MGKSELFSHFADRFEVKRTQAREFFDELTTLAEKELKRSGEFVLPGMVKLVVQKRKARMGRNPATGEADQDSGQDRRQGAHRQAAQGRGPAAQVAKGESSRARSRGVMPEGFVPLSFVRPGAHGATARTAPGPLPAAYLLGQLADLEPSILNFSVLSGMPR